jgi:diguanylate cyclase (GGDEF)-like protein
MKSVVLFYFEGGEKMIEKIKNACFYAGVDQLSYSRIKPKIQRANRTMVMVLSSIASILIAIMWASTFHTESVRMNRIVYAVGFFMSLTVFVLSLTAAKKASWVITFLIYASYSIYYLYGIFIGAVTDPDGKTVTYMVMLVFMPTLFCDRPLRMAFSTIVYDYIFIILCLENKTGLVRSVDVIDAVIFCILGIASGTTISFMKVKSYVNEQMLQEIGRVDRLTKLNNRNAYEIDLYRISKRCHHMLGCVYIDVNGLHEVNNTKGHEAGDQMLKTIANSIKEIFGEENSYRVGGDEFIIFAPDIDGTSLELMVKDLKKEVEDVNKFHIAVGCESHPLLRLFIDDLVKSAEIEMMKDKNQFYKDKVSSREARTTD